MVMSHMQAAFGSAVAAIADERVSQHSHHSLARNWKREMTSALWNESLSLNDGLTGKYTLPLALICSGGALLYAGYCLGRRQSKRALAGSDKDSQDATFDKNVLEIKCMAGNNALSRVNSEMSMTSTDESERGSPNGDNYRCALIVRKDLAMVREGVRSKGRWTVMECRGAARLSFKAAVPF